MRNLPRHAAIALLLTLLCGCGGTHTPTPLTYQLDHGLGALEAWLPMQDTKKAGVLLILSAPGTQTDFWDTLRVAALNAGYGVAIASAPSAREDMDEAYKDQCSAAMLLLNAAGFPGDRYVVVGDTITAPAALSLGPILRAAVTFSPALSARTSAEDLAKRLSGIPLLILTCENDTLGARDARALKDALGSYAELQIYSCGVRGADLLAATPNAPGQILEWLRPIVGEGVGAAAQ